MSSPESPRLRNNLYYFVPRHWARKDPKECLRWARSIQDERQRDLAIRDVAVALIDSDLEAATKLFKTLREQRDREWGYEKVVAKVAKTDPLEALRLSKTLFEPKATEPVYSLVRGWVTHDPRAAANWVYEHVERRRLRLVMFRKVADAWAAADSPAACRWILSLKDDEARFFALVAYANRALGEFSDDQLTF